MDKNFKFYQNIETRTTKKQHTDFLSFRLTYRQGISPPYVANSRPVYYNVVGLARKRGSPYPQLSETVLQIRTYFGRVLDIHSDVLGAEGINNHHPCANTAFHAVSAE